MASAIPGPRNLPESAYDLDTYWGRVLHSAEVSDPRMLLVTKSQLEKSKDLVYKYKNNEIKSMTPELWHAKLVLDSTIHPDTGEPVLLPFRMSSYVLSNLVVTVGMLTPNLGTIGTLFWQIANQSLNVAINTANANKSHPLTTHQLLTSYGLAVSASCSVALGLNAIVPRLKAVSPNTRLILGRLVPFAAVVSAGVVNVFLMRGQEIRKGITVYDQDSAEPLGTSQRAATFAVGQTAISRVINATPIMVLPPLILVRLQKKFKFSPRSELFTNLSLILATSFIALPFALGIFPQKCSLDVKHLEDKFKDIKSSSGHAVKKVVFNRGM
ncbi:Tricarboxylate/iron carrier [Lipomyces oligophaga]|uniref:Tricarboxylate/iron carrier n=1 Tax=Lipomyces oligophaga TaxID=45792 RepID=UPI0034CF033C